MIKMVTSKTTSKKLVIDEAALEELGLSSETIYTIEYDLYTERELTKAQKAKMTKEEIQAAATYSKIAREYRNKLLFLLKFKLFATKHLQSSWLLNGDRLEAAITELETFKSELRQKGFNDVDERIKIIPIFTTVEGFQHYESKKAEFVLEFIMEHVRYAEKGTQEQRISQSTLWRCKQAVSICSALADELKDNERYNEIIDTIGILDELNGKCEAFVLEQKEKENKRKGKDEED